MKFRWSTHRYVGEEIERHYVRRFCVSFETIELWPFDLPFLISSGGTLAVNVVVKILELRQLAPTSHHPIILPLPTAVVLNYAALDFNFTSWMTADNLRVLRSEQSSGNIPGLKELAEQKDHLKHIVRCLQTCFWN